MGRYPFEAQNEGALIRKILRGQYPPVTGPYSAPMVQVGGWAVAPVTGPYSAPMVQVGGQYMR